MLLQEVHLEIKCYFVVFVIKISSAFLQMIVIYMCDVDLENDICGVCDPIAYNTCLPLVFVNIEQSYVYSEYCSVLSAVIPATKR